MASRPTWNRSSHGRYHKRSANMAEWDEDYLDDIEEEPTPAQPDEDDIEEAEEQAMLAVDDDKEIEYVDTEPEALQR